jgi:hypothetical protein
MTDNDDADGPGWVSQTQALEQEGQLRNAPVEYLEALPWVTRRGQRWIHQDTLREWCGGDAVFADRAAAVLQDREDQNWRDRRGR